MNEAKLRERIEYLEADNANLRDMLAVPADADFIHACRHTLGLTPAAARMLQILLFGRRTSKLAMLHAYYNGDEGDRETKIVDIQVHHIRKALEPYSIGIETIWGDGYRMSDQAKSRALSILGIEAQP